MIKLLGRCWAGCVMRVTYYYSFTKFLGTILHQGFVPRPAPPQAPAQHTADACLWIYQLGSSGDIYSHQLVLRCGKIERNGRTVLYSKSFPEIG